MEFGAARVVVVLPKAMARWPGRPMAGLYAVDVVLVDLLGIDFRAPDHPSYWEISALASAVAGLWVSRANR
jgi:hypothetical protein